MRKKWVSVCLSAALIAGVCAGCAGTEANGAEEVAIRLSDSGVEVDGAAAGESTEQAVSVGGEIIYYHDGTDESYGEGEDSEKHSAEEAAAHTLVTIRRPGTYRVSGTLSRGQIFVDLGEGAEKDPDAVVTLILDGVDLTCTVAPAVFFYRVYECDEAWTARQEDGGDFAGAGTVDTSAAGANVVIAAGSENNITGSHVARIYREGTTENLHRYDGAFYSRMSMNIFCESGSDADARLNITADNEGLDSELHLTINGGSITVNAQDDGINANADGASVVTVNGGALTVNGGLGEEGDGIDSNGFLTVNGGLVWATANGRSGDGGIDADEDITINGGTVWAFGSRNDSVSEASAAPFLELSFAETVEGAGTGISLVDSSGEEVMNASAEREFQSLTIAGGALKADETYQVFVGDAQQQHTAGPGAAAIGGGTPPEGAGGEQPPEQPEGGQPPERPADGEPPQGSEPPEKPEDGEPPAGAEDGQRPDGPGEPPDGGLRESGQFPEMGEGSADFTLEGNVGRFFGVCAAD